MRALCILTLLAPVLATAGTSGGSGTTVGSTGPAAGYQSGQTVAPGLFNAAQNALNLKAPTNGQPAPVDTSAIPNLPNQQNPATPYTGTFNSGQGNQGGLGAAGSQQVQSCKAAASSASAGGPQQSAYASQHCDTVNWLYNSYRNHPTFTVNPKTDPIMANHNQIVANAGCYVGSSFAAALVGAAGGCSSYTVQGTPEFASQTCTEVIGATPQSCSRSLNVAVSPVSTCAVGQWYAWAKNPGNYSAYEGDSLIWNAKVLCGASMQDTIEFGLYQYGENDYQGPNAIWGVYTTDPYTGQQTLDNQPVSSALMKSFTTGWHVLDLPTTVQTTPKDIVDNGVVCGGLSQACQPAKIWYTSKGCDGNDICDYTFYFLFLGEYADYASGGSKPTSSYGFFNHEIAVCPAGESAYFPTIGYQYDDGGHRTMIVSMTPDRAFDAMDTETWAHYGMTQRCYPTGAYMNTSHGMPAQCSYYEWPGTDNNGNPIPPTWSCDIDIGGCTPVLSDNGIDHYSCGGAEAMNGPFPAGDPVLNWTIDTQRQSFQAHLSFNRQHITYTNTETWQDGCAQLESSASGTTTGSNP